MDKLQCMVMMQKNCEAILTQPETQMTTLSNMISELAEMPQNSLKLQVLALCEVFKGILPSYRLNEEHLKQRLTQVISKEER